MITIRRRDPLCPVPPGGGPGGGCCRPEVAIAGGGGGVGVADDDGGGGGGECSPPPGGVECGGGGGVEACPTGAPAPCCGGGGGGIEPRAAVPPPEVCVGGGGGGIEPRAAVPPPEVCVGGGGGGTEPCAAVPPPEVCVGGGGGGTESGPGSSHGDGGRRSRRRGSPAPPAPACSLGGITVGCPCGRLITSSRFTGRERVSEGGVAAGSCRRGTSRLVTSCPRARCTSWRALPNATELPNRAERSYAIAFVSTSTSAGGMSGRRIVPMNPLWIRPVRWEAPLGPPGISWGERPSSSEYRVAARA